MIATSMAVCAAETPDWENPEVFAVGREPVRATAYPYPTQALAIKNVPSDSPWFKSLNGSWKFNFAAKPADRPVDFTVRTTTHRSGPTSKCPPTGK